MALDHSFENAANENTKNSLILLALLHLSRMSPTFASGMLEYLLGKLRTEAPTVLSHPIE